MEHFYCNCCAILIKVIINMFLDCETLEFVVLVRSFKLMSIITKLFAVFI